jgi:hypothetical protein
MRRGGWPVVCVLWSLTVSLPRPLNNNEPRLNAYAGPYCMMVVCARARDCVRGITLIFTT